MTLPRRPFAFQLLSSLLTCYAMAGALLAMLMLRDRDPRLHWSALAIGGVAFALSAGIAAIAVWRQEARAPRALLACGAMGASLCIGLPFAAPGQPIGRDTWTASIVGGLLFAAFLLLASRYVGKRLASKG